MFQSLKTLVNSISFDKISIHIKCYHTYFSFDIFNDLENALTFLYVSDIFYIYIFSYSHTSFASSDNNNSNIDAQTLPKCLNNYHTIKPHSLWDNLMLSCIIHFIHTYYPIPLSSHIIICKKLSYQKAEPIAHESQEKCLN